MKEGVDTGITVSSRLIGAVMQKGEPMSDLIDRDGLIQLIESESRKWGDEYEIPDVLCDISDFPSAEPKRGKWIEEKEDWRNQIVWVSCSECGFASGKSYNFCPDCGASMVRGEEDE